MSVARNSVGPQGVAAPKLTSGDIHGNHRLAEGAGNLTLGQLSPHPRFEKRLARSSEWLQNHFSTPRNIRFPNCPPP